MEQAFSLSNAAARHPVRRALPPSPVVMEETIDRWENTRLFLMTFVAGFLAFYGMIA